MVPVMNRVDTGFIVATGVTPAVEKVKSILDLPDPGPVFTEEMLSLCRWIADYYCCSWGEALQCAVPGGLKIGTKMQYRLEPDMVHAGRFTERQRQVIAALYNRGALTEGQIAAAAGRGGLVGEPRAGLCPLQHEKEQPDARGGLHAPAQATDGIPVATPFRPLGAATGNAQQAALRGYVMLGDRRREIVRRICVSLTPSVLSRRGFLY